MKEQLKDMAYSFVTHEVNVIITLYITCVICQLVILHVYIWISSSILTRKRMMSPDHQHLEQWSFNTSLFDFRIIVHVEKYLLYKTCVPVPMCVSMVTCILFSPQALCDVILETVFPASAMFLLADAISDYNTAQLTLLRSGTAHLDFLNGVLLAGSMAEGLTMQLVWGHPAPDADLMALLGSMWGVTIPGKVAPGSHHGLETPLSSPETSLLIFLGHIASFFSHSTRQMESIDSFKNMISLVNTVDISKLLPILNTRLDETLTKVLTFLALTENKSCLEYAPEGCPLAYTRLRGINIEELPPTYAEFFVEDDGHHWLRTNHLNEQIQQFYNIVATYPATAATASGPAGKVWPYGNKHKAALQVDLMVEHWFVIYISNEIKISS